MKEITGNLFDPPTYSEQIHPEVICITTNGFVITRIFMILLSTSLFTNCGIGTASLKRRNTVLSVRITESEKLIRTNKALIHQCREDNLRYGKKLLDIEKQIKYLEQYPNSLYKDIQEVRKKIREVSGYSTENLGYIKASVRISCDTLKYIWEANKRKTSARLDKLIFECASVKGARGNLGDMSRRLNYR